MSAYFTINGSVDVPEDEADAFEKEIAPWLDAVDHERLMDHGSIGNAEDTGGNEPDRKRRYCFMDCYRNLGRFLPELLGEIQKRTGRVEGCLFVVSTDGCWHASIVEYRDGKTWLRPLAAQAREAQVVVENDLKMLRTVTDEERSHADGDRTSSAGGSQ